MQSRILNRAQPRQRKNHDHHTGSLLGTGCHLICDQRGRDLFEPPQRDYFVNGNRVDALSRQYELCCLLSLLGRHRWTSICIFILTVAAAEAAIGLAILVVLFRKVDTINTEDLDHLRG